MPDTSPASRCPAPAAPVRPSHEYQIALTISIAARPGAGGRGIGRSRRSTLGRSVVSQKWFCTKRRHRRLPPPSLSSSRESCDCQQPTDRLHRR